VVFSSPVLKVDVIVVTSSVDVLGIKGDEAMLMASAILDKKPEKNGKSS